MILEKIKNFVDKLNAPIVDQTYSDYYNGSDNELENIFLEILKLSEQPFNIFSVNDLQRRLDFLANEGLNIVTFCEKPKNFKLTKEEADIIISKSKSKVKKVTKKQVKKNLQNAFKDYKKNVKSSVNLNKIKNK
jgi:hypothetical protein